MGRTGTFITIDHVLEQLGREKMVDIPSIVNKIRHQRMEMVQTVVCSYVWGGTLNGLQSILQRAWVTVFLLAVTQCTDREVVVCCFSGK